MSGTEYIATHVPCSSVSTYVARHTTDKQHNDLFKSILPSAVRASVARASIKRPARTETRHQAVPATRFKALDRTRARSGNIIRGGCVPPCAHLPSPTANMRRPLRVLCALPRRPRASCASLETNPAPRRNWSPHLCHLLRCNRYLYPLSVRDRRAACCKYMDPRDGSGHQPPTARVWACRWSHAVFVCSQTPFLLGTPTKPK